MPFVHLNYAFLAFADRFHIIHPSQCTRWSSFWSSASPICKWPRGTNVILRCGFGLVRCWLENAESWAGEGPYEGGISHPNADWSFTQVPELVTRVVDVEKSEYFGNDSAENLQLGKKKRLTYIMQLKIPITYHHDTHWKYHHDRKLGLPPYMSSKQHR